jgi:O-antigen ligase
MPPTFTKHAGNLSRCAGLACAFGIPWSNAFFRVGLTGVLIALPFSGNLLQRARQCLREPIAQLALVLFLLIFASACLARQPHEMAMYDLGHYRKLLLIPIFAIVFEESNDQRRFLAAYCAGVFVLMVPTLMDGSGLLQAAGWNFTQFRNQAYEPYRLGTPNLVYWRNQIVHGFHVSVLLVASANAALHWPRWRWQLALLCALCIADISLFIYGRMALFSLLLAMGCILSLHVASARERALGMLALVTMATSAYLLIPQVPTRLNTIYSESSTFFETGDVQTSAGQRLHYWALSLQMWKEAPLLGHGAGAFRHKLEESNDPAASLGHRHPHNEYLLQLVEFGLAGLLLLVGLLITVIQTSRRISDPWLSRSVTAGVLLLCLNAITDASVHNDWEGWTFVMLAAIACASRMHSKQ